MPRRHVFIATLVVTLAACAAPRPVVWYKSGADQAQFEKDRLECEYEAMKSVQTYDPSMRTMIGQELDLAMRRSDLQAMCLRVRGYTPHTQAQSS